MSVFLKTGSIKKQNNLYYSRGLNKYDQYELRKLAEEYNIDFLDKELLTIFVDAYICNSTGKSCPFPYAAAKRRGFEDILYKNLLTVKNTAKSGNIKLHSVIDGLCREIYIEQEEALIVAEKIKNITLPKISRDTMRIIKKICKDQKELIINKYIDLNIKDYVDQLHNTNIDIDYLIINTKQVINNYKLQNQTPSTIARIYLLEKILEDLQFNNVIYNQSLKKSSGYRIYSSLTGLKKSERDLIFKSTDGYCYLELDLTSAHPSIFQKLTGLKIDNMRQKIIDETGLSKNQVKRVINSTLYGAGQHMIFTQLIEDQDIREDIENKLYEVRSYKDKIKRKELRNLIVYPDNINELKSKLKNSETYKIIKKEIVKLLNKIKIDKKMIDGFGQIIYQRQYQNAASVLASVCSSYEKLLIMPIAKLNKKLDFKVVLDSHDGLTIKLKNINDKDKVFIELKKALDLQAKKLDISTTLEIK
jgi:hypothetical protein